MSGLKIITQGLVGTAISDDKTTATLTLAEVGGMPVDVQIPASQIAAMIAGLVEARGVAVSAGAVPREALLVHDVRTWEVGTDAHVAVSVLVIDKGMASQRAFKLNPPASKDIGKALVAQSRACQQAASKTTRN